VLLVALREEVEVDVRLALIAIAEIAHPDEASSLA
jgi:hypothetical protein